MSPWITYSLVRFGLFAATFTLLMVAQLEWWWAALVATVVAFTVTYIFFPGLRQAIASDLAARRARTTPDDPDADAEDAEAQRP